MSAPGRQPQPNTPYTTAPGMDTPDTNVPDRDTAVAAASRAEVRSDDETASPLFAEDTSAALWRRWDGIQAAFVDEPRSAVEQADSLVAETMEDLAQSFARARTGLEEQWARGGDVSTEDLRVALRRYRSFFKRLLAM
jgi:hypothetical protein